MMPAKSEGVSLGDDPTVLAVLKVMASRHDSVQAAELLVRAEAPPIAEASVQSCSRRRYTPEQIDFLRARYPHMTVDILTLEFNAVFKTDLTAKAMKSTLTNHKITCGRKPGNPKGTYRIFTQEQAEFIREGYTRSTVGELTLELNKTFGSKFTPGLVDSFIGNHGIQSGRTGRFEKGSVSWNLGKKGYMGANATSFKKGNMPLNKRRLWSERINKDGFIEISVPERNPHTGAPTRFRHKHVWLWEVHNGPVPQGHACAFIDGDKTNCVLENLMLVTRAELLSMNLHGYRGTPDELKPNVLQLAKFETKAGIRIRPAGGGKRGKRNRRKH